MDLAQRSVALGALVDMNVPEVGMYLLGAMRDSTRQDWSAPNLRAFADSSIQDHVPRRGGRPSRGYSGLLARIIGDAMGWCISNGLIGPASAQSGSSGEWNVTALGLEALRRGPAHVEASRRLNVGLHPSLESDARPNFERGAYEVAVFAAMRAVEIELRAASGLGLDAFGTGLATQALREGGPFTIGAETANERAALLSLFVGAIGAFKNPSSHRAVEYADPVEAADIVHLADLLLRIIDRERARRTGDS